jgi:hypothetical protein
MVMTFAHSNNGSFIASPSDGVGHTDAANLLRHIGRLDNDAGV